MPSKGGSLAGLRPPLPPAPAFREGVNVLFAGTEEVQKVHAHVFAGLVEAHDSDLDYSAQLKCAGPDEATAHGHGGRVIDPQNRNCGSAEGRAPHEHRRLPGEMFVPAIPPRMEQSDDFSRDRINT